MESPYIRAKAYDNVDALDNVLSILEVEERQEVIGYVQDTLKDIEAVISNAIENGVEPLGAYKSFVGKYLEYSQKIYSGNTQG